VGPLETATCGGSHIFFRIVRLWDEPHKARTARLSSTGEGPDLATLCGGALDEAQARRTDREADGCWA
jgi:hypothetical protein